MSKSRSSERQALLIFARYPRLGQVKTRLQSQFSAEQVLRLYESFLLDTLDAVQFRTSWEPILCLADASSSEWDFWRSQHSLPESLSWARQTGQDLGERLWNACRDAFDSGFSRVVFIGADTPGLPPALLERAFEALCTTPIVLGPVPDGGYYLLGLSEPRKPIFEAIDWGSERVFEQTLEKFPADDFHLLPAWNDVDLVEDLLDLLRSLESDSSVSAPRTARLLRELL